MMNCKPRNEPQHGQERADDSYQREKPTGPIALFINVKAAAKLESADTKPQKTSR
jgi:hypothetical protein